MRAGWQRGGVFAGIAWPPYDMLETSAPQNVGGPGWGMGTSGGQISLLR
jgi:hypothetical protein